MCDPGYYGIDCSLEDTNHYLMENMRKTWNPYVLFFVIAIAYAMILPVMGLHKGSCSGCNGVCDLYQQLVSYAFEHISAMFNFVHNIIDPSIILIIFSDLLAYIYYSDTWRIVTIKIGMSVVLLLGSYVWWKFLLKYNTVIKPRGSFWITVFHCLIEMAYSVISILLALRLTKVHKVINFSYFYMFW